jgi:hypothetical protein
MTKITHEQAMIAFSKVYSKLPYKDKKFEDNLEVVQQFIFQQEKQEKLLKLYQELKLIREQYYTVGDRIKKENTLEKIYVYKLKIEKLESELE